MNLNDIVRAQREFDDLHGFVVGGEEPRAALWNMSKDIVGLVGEIGEFANIVKKLTIAVERASPQPTMAAIEAVRPQLTEELVDSLIYVLRLAGHLNLDLEKGYLEKVKVNEVRYAAYRRV